MPTDFWDHLKAIINNKSSTGMENIPSGSGQVVSLINASSPYANKSLLAPVAPRAVPHAINHAVGCHESVLGMENIESGSSHFVSWINGKGPYVPQPLPVDAVPQPVVVSNFCHGLTAEMFEKENLESASSQFGAYPSPCFAPVSDLPLLRNGVFRTQCQEMSDAPIVVVGKTRFHKSLGFQRVFTDRSNNVEKGTCVWSNGTHPWSEKSCGIMWVAVHGIKSICVVTRNEDLEQEVTKRMHALEVTKKEIIDVFRQGIIYKVEDLAKQIFGQSCGKPFGVVSVIPGTHKGSNGEASSAEYDEEKAMKFLLDEMESNTAFTYNKTVQTAIVAFQHLFRQKFKANEIRVIVWKEDGDIVKELQSRDDRSIEEQVAVIRAR